MGMFIFTNYRIYEQIPPFTSFLQNGGYQNEKYLKFVIKNQTKYF